MLRDHSNKWKQKHTSFWWKPLRTNHKWPHSSTLIVFLRENELFQRGWGVFVTLVEIPRGWGVISSLQKWKIQGGGGVLSEIPSVVGVWIFSGSTHCNFCVRFGTWKVWRLKPRCSAVEIPMWVTWTLFIGRLKLDMSDLTDSNVDLLTSSIEAIRFSTWKDRPLNS